ncbi:hypothetical protein [Nocardiopsis sp. B62]|uniref:hypothetical protein n=1 Tax=Nocardiopsis sp. B62 TaxID=2824874 RepID=UPI001FFD379D|nr:hypothetical protein [Nocardiopsis sp. B62]
MVHESLFGLPELSPVPVVMSLDAQRYERMWSGDRTHEFRRRFLTGAPAQWFVYLTRPEGRLCAVIDLGAAIVDTPREIARIAERESPGEGALVEEYLAGGGEVGYAMPVRRVREFSGFSDPELDRMLDGFHPPEGHVLVDDHPGWRAVCDKLLSGSVLRETAISPVY